MHIDAAAPQRKRFRMDIRRNLQGAVDDGCVEVAISASCRYLFAQKIPSHLRRLTTFLKLLMDLRPAAGHMAFQHDCGVASRRHVSGEEGSLTVAQVEHCCLLTLPLL